MRQMLKTELHKAFLNKWFAISLLVMSILGITNALEAHSLFKEVYDTYVQQITYADSDFSTLSLFGYLIITNVDLVSTEGFYLLFPIAATMPYSWSLCKESNNGYLTNVYTRTKKQTYLASKCIATFAVSFVVILVPLMLNLVVTACLIPAFMPDISSLIYNGIGDTRLWSSVYYTTPLLYCVLFSLLCSIFSGLWGSAVQIMGSCAKRQDKLLASSFICLFSFQAFERVFHYGLEGTELGYLAFSPLDFMRASGTGGSSTSELSFLVWLFGIAGTMAVVTLLNKKRDEL